ncbi:MAG: hypothetical protein E4H46_04400 [Desulfobacterales bacterium]|nr:MAG: hypothetical protein E4H46_04400 [Desulfobacterales bacterium]
MATAPKARRRPERRKIAASQSFCITPIAAAQSFKVTGTNPTGPQTGSLEMNQYEVEAGLGFLF